MSSARKLTTLSGRFHRFGVSRRRTTPRQPRWRGRRFPSRSRPPFAFFDGDLDPSVEISKRRYRLDEHEVPRVSSSRRDRFHETLDLRSSIDGKGTDSGVKLVYERGPPSFGLQAFRSNDSSRLNCTFLFQLYPRESENYTPRVKELVSFARKSISCVIFRDIVAFRYRR